MGGHVAQRDAVAEHQVNPEQGTGGFRPLPGAVAAFPRQLQAGFVIELIGPAPGVGHMDDVVPGILDPLTKRHRPDHAGGEFDQPELVVELGVEQDRAVEPRGVGPVTRDERGRRRVRRRVDVVAEGEAGLVVPINMLGIHPRDEASGGLHKLAGLVQVGLAQPRELEPVGVVTIGAREVFVILADNREAAVLDLKLGQSSAGLACDQGGAGDQV